MREKFEPKKEDIEDTKEPLISENFEIYYNNKIKEILEDGDNKKFDEIKDSVDKILGSKREMEEKNQKSIYFQIKKNILNS